MFLQSQGICRLCAEELIGTPERIRGTPIYKHNNSQNRHWRIRSLCAKCSCPPFLSDLFFYQFFNTRRHRPRWFSDVYTCHSCTSIVPYTVKRQIQSEAVPDRRGFKPQNGKKVSTLELNLSMMYDPAVGA